MVILAHTMSIGIGRFGVQLFFVISGFLLGKYYENQSKKQFMLHRFFRLFPLAIIIILLFYMNQMSSINELLLNLSLLQNLWWGNYQFAGGWSISSEWIYSIILISFFPSKKRLYILLTMICILNFFAGFYIFSIGGVSEVDSPDQYAFKTWVNTTNPFINYGFFVSGILIRHVENMIKNIKNWILMTFILLMTVQDLIIGHFMLGWQFAIPALFILCLKISNKMNVLILKFCQFVGKRTYGMFFVHFIIWNNLDYFFSDQQVDFLTGSILGKIAQFLLVYSFSLLGGSITYAFIEKPFLKFSKKIVVG
jgi:peptidoglycan/LPS O-acetylase OafA/YrhL